LVAEKRKSEDVFFHFTRKDPASPRNKKLKEQVESKDKSLASLMRI
jgi:hypothetical protein